MLSAVGTRAGREKEDSELPHAAWHEALDAPMTAPHVRTHKYASVRSKIYFSPLYFSELSRSLAIHRELCTAQPSPHPGVDTSNEGGSSNQLYMMVP